MDNQPQQTPPNPPDNSGMDNPLSQNITQPVNQSVPTTNSSASNNLPQSNSPVYQAPDVNQQPVQPANNQPPHTNSPALIVLQWLTYAFWGWTVLTMSVLTTTVLANFIAKTNDGAFMPYAIAAVLVLLPISVICDFFYSKQEPVKKTGAASVVMIIHAVLFALFGIAALITIVISLVELFTSSSASNFTHVALFSALIITVLYAALFLRTLNILKLKWFHLSFVITMIAIVGIFSILAIVGPVANARVTRNDTLIDTNLPTIQSSIDNYVNTNNSLPTSLGNIGLTGDAQKLVSDKLVDYIPNSKQQSSFSSAFPSSSSSTFYYELCVTYKKASSSDGGGQYSPITTQNNYSAGLTTYTHPAGYYCYKVSSVSY